MVRSALITRRNTQDSLLVVALLLVTSLASVSFGYMLHGVQASPQFRCPRIEGLTPVSSSSTDQGHFCTYVQTYGLAVKKVRL